MYDLAGSRAAVLTCSGTARDLEASDTILNHRSQGTQKALDTKLDDSPPPSAVQVLKGVQNAA